MDTHYDIDDDIDVLFDKYWDSWGQYVPSVSSEDEVIVTNNGYLKIRDYIKMMYRSLIRNFSFDVVDKIIGRGIVVSRLARAFHDDMDIEQRLKRFLSMYKTLESNPEFRRKSPLEIGDFLYDYLLTQSLDDVDYGDLPKQLSRESKKPPFPKFMVLDKSYLESEIPQLFKHYRGRGDLTVSEINDIITEGFRKRGIIVKLDKSDIKSILQHLGYTVTRR